MELTVSSIISFVTLIIGFISKKFKIVSKKFIPYQNIIIGIVSGVLVYLTKVEEDFYRAIVCSLMAALSAGGLYDVLPKKETTNEE